MDTCRASFKTTNFVLERPPEPGSLREGAEGEQERCHLVIPIPAIACGLVLAKGSARKALVSVYLPVVLLLTRYFLLRFSALLPLTFADAAIFLVILSGSGMRLLRLAAGPIRQEDGALVPAHMAVLVGLAAALAIG